MTKTPDPVLPSEGGSYVQEKDGTLTLVEGTREPTLEERLAREEELRAAALAELEPPGPSRRSRASAPDAPPAAS